MRFEILLKKTVFHDELPSPLKKLLKISHPIIPETHRFEFGIISAHPYEDAVEYIITANDITEKFYSKEVSILCFGKDISRVELDGEIIYDENRLNSLYKKEFTYIKQLLKYINTSKF